MEATKKLVYVCIGGLFILAGGLVSYAIGWVMALIISGVAWMFAILPGANMIAEILSGAKIVIHIVISIIAMIYLWSKYEDKSVIKNFRAAIKDFFGTLKDRDYSKEKAIIKECGSKIKEATSSATEKLGKNMENVLKKKEPEKVVEENTEKATDAEEMQTNNMSEENNNF